MNILLDFRPFLHKIPSNGEYFCEDFFHALFRNHPSDIFYIWTTGSEHLPAQYKFDQYHNVRRIHTEIEIDTLYRLISYLKYPSIDDLVETLAMKNGHMAWVGKFDAAFFATPMPVLLEGDCIHVQITNHLKPLHYPDMFLQEFMQYQEKKAYIKNWKNADINIVPSNFLAKELLQNIDEDSDETSIFKSNIGVTQDIIRFIPHEGFNINESQDQDILEMNTEYKANTAQQEIYDDLPEHFFYSQETIDTVQNTIQAFSLFCSRYSQSEMHLIIEEPFKDAFKFTHFLQRNNKIIIIPPASKEKKIILYSKCIAFIKPDIYDTEGKGLLEAMKCGSILICSTYGALPEICPSENFFFSPTESTELFKQMKNAYNIKEEEKNTISQNNITVASSSQYSWDDITIAIIKNIADLLEEKELSM